MNTLRRAPRLLLAVIAGLILLQAESVSQSSASGAGAVGIRRTQDANKRLEDLHIRVAAHAKADDDESAISTRLHLPSISPERAAQLALLSHGGGRLTSIELQNRNGIKAYRIKIDQAVHYVDALSGGVTRGDRQ